MRWQPGTHGSTNLVTTWWTVATRPLFEPNSATAGRILSLGYTLVTAENLAAALALAAECPMLAARGGVEVGELTLLNSGHRQLVSKR